jgi:hypothetical protein
MLAPVLAQLVTLNVGDRTEARYISGENSHFEGATRPYAGLNFGWKRSTLTLMYMPSITVSPLERRPRNVAVFQGGSITGTYRWRRTALTVSGFAGYGELTFRVQALADPGVTTPTPGPNGMPTPPATPQSPTPTGGTTGTPGNTGNTTPTTPNTGATQQLRLKDQIVHYFTWSTNIGVTHAVSRQVGMGWDASFTEGRGLGDSAEQYPVTRGARTGVYVGHRLVLGRRDSLGSSAGFQYVISSNGNNAWVATVNENWLHRLSMRTTTNVGVGLSGTRFSQEDGTIGYSIYPTVSASISHFNRLAGGMLTMSLSTTAAPYLDPLRATVDPRLSFAANIGWAKRRFSAGASAGTALSLAKDNQKGAVNSIGASLFASYLLGAGFSVDGGLGTAWQTYEGASIIPASWSAFLGITFGAGVPLNSRAH